MLATPATGGAFKALRTHTHRHAWWLAPIVLLACLTLPKIGQGDWMRGDSGWYAAIALQSWRTGSLWTLFEGPDRPYFNKPPLAFWIQGAWMSLAGAGAWQARLGTIAAAAIVVAATTMIARRLAGRRVALRCGVLLAVGVEFFRRTREISLDMWMLAFMLMAALAMIRLTGRWRRDWPWIACAGAAIGAAILIKPVVAMAAPIIVAAFLAGFRRRGEARCISLPRAMAAASAVCLVAAVVAAPWYASMVMTHGEAFTSRHFGHEIADRAAGQPVGGQSRTQPVWFYAVNLASSWTFWLSAGALGVAVATGVGGAKWLDLDRRAILRFGLLWAAAWFLLLTAFPDRRDRYALPIHAGLALAVGAVVGGRSRAISRGMRWVPPAAVAAACVVSALPLRLQRPINEQWPALFRWLEEGAVGPVWDGSFSGAPAARVYLETGLWPRTTRDLGGNVTAEPPTGAIILYHRRGGWSPGPSETIVWEMGDLAAARLDQPPWRPERLSDPGE